MANQPQGSFIPTTNIWDASQVYSVEDIDPQLQELLVRMYQNLNQMAINVNLKDTGYYSLVDEFVNGQLFFAAPSDTNQNNYRPASRRTFFFTALSAGAVSQAHNIPINSSFNATRVYGAATNPSAMGGTPAFIPLPYVSATNIMNNIELDVTAMNIVITSGGFDYSAYRAIVVVEYLVQ